MFTIHRTVPTALLVLATVLPAPAVAATDDRLAGILEKMPSEDPAENRALCEKALARGADGIRELVDLLVAPKEGAKNENDGTARLLLHGMAMHVAGPAGDKHRAVFVDVLTKALASEKPARVKEYLLRQLRHAGGTGDETMAALAALLTDEYLADHAARSILMAGRKDAAALFRTALPAAKGQPRVVIIQALGRLRDTESLPAILKHTASEDAATRRAAVYAASAVGDPAAAEAIRAAVQNATGQEKGEMTDNYLLFIRRLGEEGHGKKAAALCRALMKERPEEDQVRCACLTELARIGDEQALDEIIDAMASKNDRIRDTARRLVAALPAGAITADAVDRMIAGAAAVKHAEILKLLGQREDPAGLAAARDGLTHEDESVRRAAIEAVGRIGGVDAVGDLVGVLRAHEAKSGAYTLAQTVLARIPGDKATAAIAGAMQKAQPGIAAALLEVLGDRNAEAHTGAIFAAAGAQDEAVRVAAVNALKQLVDDESLPDLVGLLVDASTENVRRAAEKAVAVTCRRIGDPKRYLEPITDRMEKAPPAARAALLRVLGILGGDAALEPVAAAVDSTEDDVRETAVRVLSAWEDGAAMTPLWGVIEKPGSEKEGILALRGYIELAGRLEPAAKAVDALSRAMNKAARTEEKKMVLGQLASRGSGAALDMAAEYLDTEGIASEATLACRKIIPALGKLAARERRDLLEQLAGGDDEKLAAAAGEKLTALKSDRYEAEAAKLSGCKTETGHGGYSGKAYVNFNRTKGAVIAWTVAVLEDGPCVLGFRYALGGGNRPLKIAVDGTTVKEDMAFPDSGGWDTWTTATLEVELKKGEHVVTAETIGKEGPNMDCLQVGTKQVLPGTSADPHSHSNSGK